MGQGGLLKNHLSQLLFEDLFLLSSLVQMTTPLVRRLPSCPRCTLSLLCPLKTPVPISPLSTSPSSCFLLPTTQLPHFKAIISSFIHLSATQLSDFTFTFMHWRRKWQPTPVFLPGESQGQGSLVGCLSMGSHRIGHNWSDLAAAANTSLPALGRQLDQFREQLLLETGKEGDSFYHAWIAPLATTSPVGRAERSTWGQQR